MVLGYVAPPGARGLGQPAPGGAGVVKFLAPLLASEVDLRLHPIAPPHRTAQGPAAGGARFLVAQGDF